MAKNLDSLLEGIEGEGGFRDASITSQTQCLAGLEEDIWALSSRCRIRKVCPLYRFNFSLCRLYIARLGVGNVFFTP